jgi:hypothetical protein
MPRCLEPASSSSSLKKAKKAKTKKKKKKLDDFVLFLPHEAASFEDDVDGHVQAGVVVVVVVDALGTARVAYMLGKRQTLWPPACTYSTYFDISSSLVVQWMTYW